MASKFQKAIAELRSKIALQSAQTIARLKQVETDLHAKLDASMDKLRKQMDTFQLEVTDSLVTGFSKFETALSDQARQNEQNLNTLLELISAQEQEQASWREKVEERLDRLERQNPAA